MSQSGNNRNESEKMAVSDSEEPLDIEKMKMAIDVGKRMITKVSGDVKNLFIMVGKSGVGKSTSIAALSEQELKAFFHLGQPVLIDKGHIQGQNNALIKRADKAYIGIGASAATSEPVFVKLKSTSTNDQGYYLVDIPGFRDNKGVTQIVINAYYISRIFNMFEKISLFFTIELSFLSGGDRGERLCKSFLEFVDILGSVSTFSKSFCLLITKAQKKITKDQITKQFESLIMEVAAIKANQKLLQLCGLIANGKVPILVIYEPKLDSETCNTYENAVIVTDQYKNVISEARTIMKQLQSHRFQNIYPPKLSLEDLRNCKQFVKSAKDNIISLRQTFVGRLEKFLKHSLTLSDSLSISNWENKFEPINKGTAFFKKIEELIQKSQDSSGKERLFNFFNQFQSLASNQPYFQNANEEFNSNQSVNGNISRLGLAKDVSISSFPELQNANLHRFQNLTISELIIELKDNFIMIDFLSLLDFTSVDNQLGNWLNPQKIINHFFDMLNFKAKIQIYHDQINQKLENYSIKLIEKFIDQMPSSVTYQLLEKQSRILPNYFLKLTTYSRSQDVEGFCEEIVSLKNGDIYFDTDSILKLDSMIKAERRFLNNWKPRQNLKEQWKKCIKRKGQALVQKIFHQDQWQEKEKVEGQQHLAELTREKPVNSIKIENVNESNVRMNPQELKDIPIVSTESKNLIKISQLEKLVQDLTAENQRLRQQEDTQNVNTYVNDSKKGQSKSKCCCQFM